MKKQPKFIAVTLQKGGIGKSTVALNLAAILSMKKRSKYSDYYNRVLIIDGDDNSTTSKHLGVYKESNKNLYDILVGNCTFDEAIYHYSFNYGPPYKKPFLIDIIPSFSGISELDVKNHFLDEPELLLRKAIMESDRIMDYDYVICDCPQEGVTALSNFYNICNKYLIVIKPDKQSTECIGTTLQNIGLLTTIQKENFYVGVLINNYQKTEIANNIVKKMQDSKYLYCFHTILPYSKDCPDTFEKNLTIPDYRKKTRKCKRLNVAFKKFTDEFLARLNEMEWIKWQIEKGYPRSVMLTIKNS